MFLSKKKIDSEPPKGSKNVGKNANKKTQRQSEGKKTKEEPDVDVLLKQINVQNKKTKLRAKKAESRAKKAESKAASGGETFWDRMKNKNNDKKPATINDLLKQINEQNQESERKAEKEKEKCFKAMERALKAEERADKAEARVKELEAKIDMLVKNVNGMGKGSFVDEIICW